MNSPGQDSSPIHSGLLQCLVGKTISDARRIRVRRRGLWAACVVLLLGVGVLVVGIRTGSAKDEGDEDEDAGAKCSEATLNGTYLFAHDGVKIEGMTSSRSPMQAMMSLTATVRSKPSFQATLTGRLFVSSTPPARIPSRRIAQAPSPLRMVRRAICSSPQTAACSRSSRSNPSLV